MGLSDFIRYRSSLEPRRPGRPRFAKDALAFYPIIYWPVTATAPMPRRTRSTRIDAYMRAGGTVLFRHARSGHEPRRCRRGPNTERLQAILASLDIPPLSRTAQPCADEVLLSPAELPRPLCREPALDRGDG